MAPDRFFYSPAEKTGFDLEGFLVDRAPHLLPYRETISHWCGFSTVSPRIALALIERQSCLLSDATPDGRFARPLGDLAPVEGFSRQLEVVLVGLADEVYRLQSRSEGVDLQAWRLGPSRALAALLAERPDSETEPLAELSEIYSELFPDQPPLSRPLAPEVIPSAATAPDNYLQLPFPVGARWSFDGTHTFDGNDPGPMASIDFSRNWPPWGANTRGDRVVASHPGTVKVHSSCFLQVLGVDGWSTSYYHLDHIEVADGQRVDRDQPLAVYADNPTQALCDGGHSTGPHVHFSLIRNGRYYTLDGSELSGLRVHAGRYSYDTNCQYFWLGEGTEKHCAYTTIWNEGIFRTLEVIRRGPDGGLVTSSPAGIFCGGECQHAFLHGTGVTLTASSDPGVAFAGWSGGGCSGLGACTLSLVASTTVSAEFTTAGVLLGVVRDGAGAGVVTSEPAGIDCGSSCQRRFAEDTVMTLTAVAGPHSVFGGWSGGGCSGLPPCTVVLHEPITVTAHFDSTDDGPWLAAPTLPGYRLTATFSAGQRVTQGAVVDDCLAETLCVAGALPDRPELFLRVVGPKPNGFLWPNLVKFSTAAVDVRVEQSATGEVRDYGLPAATPGVRLIRLDGLADKGGFEPVATGGPQASSPLPMVGASEGPAPPDGAWLESTALPGFRAKVRISARDMVREGTPVADCIGETLCAAGALPERAEIFVRVVGPKPNGFLWPTLVKFSTSQLEVWLEQTATGEVQYYLLPAADAGKRIIRLDGLADKLGFEP